MEAIYNAYYDKIYKWAIKKTNSKEDAEDLTNSVFLAIFEYLSKDIAIAKIENLIWKIAYNLWCTKARTYIKEKGNTSFDEQLQANAEGPILDKIIYKEIINNLTDIGLTPREKQAFKLYYIDDLSIKEISEKLGTKEANIKYYLYSARNKVKEEYHE